MSADREGTCPVGSLWYTCTVQSPTFLGCCASNPCNGVGCPPKDLRPAEMGVGPGPDFLLNDSSFWPNVYCAQGKWWTCAAQSPSFQGCCDSNPCGEIGCPSISLHPAAFSTLPPVLQTSFYRSSTLVATSTSGSSSATTSSVSALPAQQTSATSLSQPTGSSSSPPVAAIAGGTVGGIFFLVVLGIIGCLLRRKRNRKNVRSTNSFPAVDPAGFPATYSGNRDKSLEAFSGRKWRPFSAGSPRWSRFIPSSMASPQSTPLTPPPLYGYSPSQGATSAIHELDTNYPSNPDHGENHGLGVRSPVLHEADAQADTPNPFPVQREWSRRRISELAENPTVSSQRDSQRDDRPREGELRENYATWQNLTS